jgi:Family of unknown function (DUF6328)
VYSATVACSIGSTALLVAPVGMHRLLFRQHRLQTVVATAHRCAVAGLMLLGVALCGVAVVTFNAGFGVAAGGVEGFCTAVAILAFWSVFTTTLAKIR